MADILRTQGTQIPGATITRLKDMGDTTHALVVSAQADLRVNDADVSTSNPFPVIEIGTITPTHTNVRLSGTGLLIAANTNRKYLLIVNDSTVVYYINLGNVAGLNEGIRLNANGSSYEMSAQSGNLYTGAIYGIPSSGANQNILITEGT